jgi:predicted RNase H-like HicB family nuclease
MKFKVVLEEDEEVGGYVVECPALPGCVSEGDTIEEALENINLWEKKRLKSSWKNHQQEC